MAYSVDLREKAIGAYEAGQGSYEEIATLFGLGYATLNRWLRLKRETGEVRKRPHGGGKPRKLSEKQTETFRAIVLGEIDASRKEIAEAFRKETRLTISPATVGRTLRRIGFTRKKRQSTTRKETKIAF